MLLYFPFFHISTQCSVLKLFGSPLFQRHVPADVPLTQAILSFNQLHVWDPSNVFKPMNQRGFVWFLVKLWTKCHSFSVSIETSKPFPWSLHFLLAILQSFISWWKVYLEQTVTMGGRPIKEKKDKQGKRSIYLSFTCLIFIIQELEDVTTLGHTQKLNVCHGAVGIGWTKLWISKIRSLHKSKTSEGVAPTFPSPSVLCLWT